MLRRALTSAALCLVVFPISVRAQDANAAQDYRIRLAVVQVINVGKDVYNAGDHAGWSVGARSSEEPEACRGSG